MNAEGFQKGGINLASVIREHKKSAPGWIRGILSSYEHQTFAGWPSPKCDKTVDSVEEVEKIWLWNTDIHWSLLEEYALM